MENRIKEYSSTLFADRVSRREHARQPTSSLPFCLFAYLLVCADCAVSGLKATTELATAQAATIRLRLLKIGALVRVSVRRVKIAMASGCPYAREWALAHARLCRTIAA